MRMTLKRLYDDEKAILARCERCTSPSVQLPPEWLAERTSWDAPAADAMKCLRCKICAPRRTTLRWKIVKRAVPSARQVKRDARIDSENPQIEWWRD